MTIGEQQKLRLEVLKSHVNWLKEAVANGIIQDNGQIASLKSVISLFENQTKHMACGGLNNDEEGSRTISES